MLQRLTWFIALVFVTGVGVLVGPSIRPPISLSSSRISSTPARQANELKLDLGHSSRSGAVSSRRLFARRRMGERRPQTIDAYAGRLVTARLCGHCAGLIVLRRSIVSRRAWKIARQLWLGGQVNANKYNIDRTRIGVTGMSAGDISPVCWR
jgi:hypothetical protein